MRGMRAISSALESSLYGLNWQRIMFDDKSLVIQQSCDNLLLFARLVYCSTTMAVAHKQRIWRLKWYNNALSFLSNSSLYKLGSDGTPVQQGDVALVSTKLVLLIIIARYCTYRVVLEGAASPVHVQARAKI